MLHTLPEFLETLTQIFQPTTLGKDAAKALVSLRQDNCSVFDYTITFHTIATDSGWIQLALINGFFNILSKILNDHLAPLDLPEDLEVLINFVSIAQ